MIFFRARDCFYFSNFTKSEPWISLAFILIVRLAGCWLDRKVLCKRLEATILIPLRGNLKRSFLFSLEISCITLCPDKWRYEKRWYFKKCTIPDFRAFCENSTTRKSAFSFRDKGKVHLLDESYPSIVNRRPCDHSKELVKQPTTKLSEDSSADV